jgi:SCP-2 sterol transfer family
MARFLTPEWVEELNRALTEVSLPAPGPEDALSAAEGRFTVVQEVHGSPDGDRLLVLHVDGSALRFELTSALESDAVDAEVTIALDYGDAAALSRGELTPADALGAGRIRVRGDLSILVAAQRLLEAARPATSAVATSTTY